MTGDHHTGTDEGSCRKLNSACDHSGRQRPHKGQTDNRLGHTRMDKRQHIARAL